MMLARKPPLRSIAAGILAMALLCALAGTASACPSCKAALASQENGARVVQGFMWSILFMLSMPFTILGSMSGYFYYLVRKARREQIAQGILPVGNEPQPPPLAGAAARPSSVESSARQREAVPV